MNEYHYIIYNKLNRNFIKYFIIKFKLFKTKNGKISIHKFRYNY